MSQLISVNCSIPQGSVFSSVEFITYTEDVVTVFKKHRVRYQLYADDIQAYSAWMHSYRTLIKHGIHFNTASLTLAVGVRHEDCS